MNSVYRGLGVAILQCLLVMTVAGKYAWDRERLPRVWARAAPFDPNLPIRGRYVSLRLQVDRVPGTAQWLPGRLSAVGGRLVATPDPAGTAHVTPGFVNNAAAPDDRQWLLVEPVAFFISEHVPDPSLRAPGEELWVEVSVPARGAPRPIRLGVKKNGVIQPLEL